MWGAWLEWFSDRLRIKSEALLLGVPVCIGSLVAPRWVFVAVVVHVRQLGYVLRRRASRGCSKVVLVCTKFGWAVVGGGLVGSGGRDGGGLRVYRCRSDKVRPR